MPGKSKSNGKYSLGVKTENGLHDVELPSGHTVQARRPGVQGLVAAGLLDNFDELTAIVQTDHLERVGPRSVAGTPKVTAEDTRNAAEAVMRDPKKIATALHMMDRLAAHVIVQPPVWIDYQQEGESDEDFAKRSAEAQASGAYAIREVEIEDKMFLMNWAVGGSADLAAFREETGKLLGSVEAGPAI